jgi:hypothetical protein
VAATESEKATANKGFVHAGYVVTLRSGGSSADMATAMRPRKEVWLKHGAADVQPGQVAAGPDTGNWIIRIAFPSWETFGKAMQSGSGDAALGKAIGGLGAVSALVERQLIGGIELYPAAEIVSQGVPDDVAGGDVVGREAAAYGRPPRGLPALGDAHTH